MMEYLTGDPSGNFDKDQSTIQCLAHVIHLAVIDLLVHIKAMAKKEADNAPIEIAINMDEQAANNLGTKDPEGYADKSDKDLWILFDEIGSQMIDRSAGKKKVDMVKMLWKVSVMNHAGLCHMSHPSRFCDTFSAHIG